MHRLPYDGTARTFNEVLEFLSLCYRLDGRLQNWSVARLGNWRFGGNSKRLKSDPEFFNRNLHIWRDGDGIVGAVVADGGGVVTLLTHPHRRGIETEMLDWVEDEFEGPADRCTVTCWNNDTWLQALLRDRSYAYAESGGFNRKYDTHLSPHRSPLPDGFRMTTLEAYGDAEGYISAVSEAFGRATIDREWYDSNITAPCFSPRWVVLIESPDGHCASFCDVRIDRGAGYAEIDPIGTRPQFQRKGLARACIAECFRRLSEEGIRNAYIGSAPEPAPSNKLYDSLRPVERYEEMVWERKR